MTTNGYPDYERFDITKYGRWFLTVVITDEGSFPFACTGEQAAEIASRIMKKLDTYPND